MISSYEKKNLQTNLNLLLSIAFDSIQARLFLHFEHPYTRCNDEHTVSQRPCTYGYLYFIHRIIRHSVLTQVQTKHSFTQNVCKYVNK